MSGTFTYTPASGTMLNAGSNQALAVTFAPADTSSWNNASGGTTITVNQVTTLTQSLSSGAGTGFAVTLSSAGQAAQTIEL